MQIFAGVPRVGNVKREWGCRRGQFSSISVATSSESLEIGHALAIAILYRPVTDYKMNDLK